MGIYIDGFKMPEGGYRTIEIAYDADGHPMALADGGDVFDVIPAADVRPVVRGKWKKVGTQMHLNLDNAREQYRELGYPHRNIECLQCSNCRMVSMVDESIRYEFCPHCGADMMEVDDE